MRRDSLPRTRALPLPARLRRQATAIGENQKILVFSLPPSEPARSGFSFVSTRCSPHGEQGQAAGAHLRFPNRSRASLSSCEQSPECRLFREAVARTWQRLWAALRARLPATRSLPHGYGHAACGCGARCNFFTGNCSAEPSTGAPRRAPGWRVCPLPRGARASPLRTPRCNEATSVNCRAGAVARGCLQHLGVHLHQIILFMVMMPSPLPCSLAAQLLLATRSPKGHGGTLRPSLSL